MKKETEEDFTKVWTALDLKNFLSLRTDEELKMMFIKFDIPNLEDSYVVDDGRGIEILADDMLYINVGMWKK